MIQMLMFNRFHTEKLANPSPVTEEKPRTVARACDGYLLQAHGLLSIGLVRSPILPDTVRPSIWPGTL